MSRASFKLCLALGVLASCNRQGPSLPSPSVERIALFPVEALSSNPAAAQFARALPLLIDLQLSGQRDMATVVIQSANEGAEWHANRELRGYIEGDGRQLSVRLHDRRPGGKTERVIVATSASLGEMARTIASQMSTRARKLPEASEEALQAFAAGLTAGSSLEGVNQLARATQLAPNFGPAWLQLGEALWDGGRRDQAIQTWQAALARGNEINEISRARIRGQLASFTQSPDLAAAIIDLARVLPADAEAQYRAGEMLMATHQAARAVEAYNAAVAADPSRGVYLNALAYGQGLAGDFNGAVATIERYERLEPKNPNPIDSKGEIQFLARRFADAARSFETAYAADPNFIEGFTQRKAAEAHLLAGDAAAGERVMKAWVDKYPSNSPIRERLLATWEHRTGKRAEAITRLIAVSDQDPASLAQAVVWLTQDGDRTRAFEFASRLPGATGQLLRLIAMPSAAAAEWNVRSTQSYPNPNQLLARRLALIYALALDRKWEDVAAMLARDYPQMNPLRSSQILALYRRALTETKRTSELEKLPDFPMLPTQGSDGLFDSLIYAP